jgi:hypothetical protein
VGGLEVNREETRPAAYLQRRSLTVTQSHLMLAPRLESQLRLILHPSAESTRPICALIRPWVHLAGETMP